MYRALFAFYKATIIHMVRWICLRMGLELKTQHLLGAVTVNSGIVLERISAPEVSLEEFIYPENLDPWGTQDRRNPKRQRIHTPSAFAIWLAAYVKKLAGECPLCGYNGHESSADKEELKEK